MSFTREDLDNLSLLARITVKEEEKDKMLADMQAILGYVSDLSADHADQKGSRGQRREVVYNVVREDVITHQSGAYTEAVLAEAPETEDGYVKVSQVLK